MQLQSSDDESPAEEEAEVIRLQNERAKSMSMADFGAEDTSEDDGDRELTLEVCFENHFVIIMLSSNGFSPSDGKKLLL